MPVISKEYFIASSPSDFGPYPIGIQSEKSKFIHCSHCTLQMIFPFSPVFLSTGEMRFSSRFH